MRFLIPNFLRSTFGLVSWRRPLEDRYSVSYLLYFEKEEHFRMDFPGKSELCTYFINPVCMNLAANALTSSAAGLCFFTTRTAKLFFYFKKTLKFL